MDSPVNEMVEKVARAIGAVSHKPPELELLWEDFVPEAIAVFKAIRIPTEAMLKAAYHELYQADLEEAGPVVGAIWAAMIDEALKP